MTQPLPLNFLENPLSIQNFIKFHQANANLGLALLAQNQGQMPFFPKRSNMILSMNQNQTPIPPMAFEKVLKPNFPQNLFEAKFNQAPRPFPFMNYPENLNNTLENPFKSQVKMEDSHHSDVTKDSESVKKEEEMLTPEGKSQINIKSKKIVKTPKLRRAAAKKPTKKNASPKSEEEEGGQEEAEPKWRRKCWSHSEDKQLLDLIEKYGRKWSKMAAIIGGRTGKQVRDRYLNVLIPDIKRTTWTELEDNLIWALYFQLGTKWCKIAEHLPGRTEGQVKNRFYTYLKRKHEKEDQEAKVNLVIKPNLQQLVPIKMKQEEMPDRSKTICPKIEA